MDLYLIYKCVMGALIMLVIHFLTKSNYYYITGLLALFPALSIPAYYFMYFEKGADAIQKTNLFGLLSLIAYVAFVLTIFFTVKKLGIVYSLLLSTGVWSIIAFALMVIWKR
ncbi:MAG: GlpM family protein [Arenicella sp.]